MSDRINLLQKAESLDISPQFDSYSKVIINIDENTQITAGNDYGRTLEFDCPYGTQAMANQILTKLRGFQYQPATATGALLDPAAEMGDGISARDVYFGLYSRERDFSKLMAANISAPYEEEINHEYKFEPPQERKFKREIGDVRATLSIESDRITAEVAQRQADSAEFRSQLSVQATEIAARVTQTGGNQSSFGWSLLSNEFGLYAGNTKVFWVNSSGAHVKGEITATSGKIGGFTIGQNAIYNNINRYGGTQTTGVYVGTDGIQLGQNFKVNPSGGVYAANLSIVGGAINMGNGTFQVSSDGSVIARKLALNGGSISIGQNFGVDSDGNLYAQSGTFRGNVSAGNIQYGGSYGTFSGGGLTDGTIGSAKYGWESIGSGALGSGAVVNAKIGNGAITDGKIYGGTITTGSLSSGINTSLYNADDAHGVAYTSNGNGYISARFVTCSGNFYFQNHTCKWITIDGIPVISY